MITPNAYVVSVLRKYALPAGHRRQADLVRSDLDRQIRSWGGTRVRGITRSGSFAKGTAIRGGTDLDIFVSLNWSKQRTLRDMYEDLYAALQNMHLAPSRQNVSIGLVVRGLKVDVVPGRRHAGITGDHSLYKHLTDSWTQTNIGKHIRLVKRSGLLNEIRALKIWRRLHNLEFPSIYLELATIQAMRGRRRLNVPRNLATIWEWMAKSIETARIVDPANTANIISDDTSTRDKNAIAAKSRWSLASNWEDVLH